MLKHAGDAVDSAGVDATIRTRPAWVAVQIATNSLLVAPLVGIYVCVTTRSLVTGLTAVLAVLVMVGLIVVRQTRRRFVHLSDEGIMVRRNGYRMAVRWADIAHYHRVRFAGLFSVEVFDISTCQLLDRELPTAAPAELTAKVRRAGADRRVQICTYASSQDERLASLLRRHRPDLGRPGSAAT